MEELHQHIRQHAQYLGNGIIKADAFVNHQLLPDLTFRMGREFADRFARKGVSSVTRILTAEVSGIAPALATAQAMDVPMVFARKKKPAFMKEPLLSANAVSRTKDDEVTLYVSSEYLGPDDRVIIIDDFLATASTLKALVTIVENSGAALLGIGCIIEKVFEKGRSRLEPFGVPLISLACINISKSTGGFSIEITSPS